MLKIKIKKNLIFRNICITAFIASLSTLGYISITNNWKYHNIGLVINSEISGINNRLDKMDIMIKQNIDAITRVSSNIKSMTEQINAILVERDVLGDNHPNKLFDLVKKINFLNLFFNKMENSESIDEISFLAEQFRQMFLNDYIIQDVVYKNAEFFNNLEKTIPYSKKLLLIEFNNRILPRIKSTKNFFNFAIGSYHIDMTRYLFFPSDIEFLSSIRSNLNMENIVGLIKTIENNSYVDNTEVNIWVAKSKINLALLEIILEMQKSFEDFIFSI